MNVDKYDIDLFKFLFEQDCCNGELQNESELKENAMNLLNKIGWEKLLEDLYSFLEKEINNRYNAFNFATWILIYGYNKIDVVNPYPFLALIYKKMQLDEKIDDELEKRFDDPYSRFCDIYYEAVVCSHIMSIGDSELLIPENDGHLMDEIKKIDS